MYECKNFANELTQIDFLEVDVSVQFSSVHLFNFQRKNCEHNKSSWNQYKHIILTQG